MTSKVKQFYSNTNVLITGGTGFIGQLLIQKCLQTFDDIEGIYLIVRVHKGQNVTARIETMCEDPIFQKLREEKSSCLEKIHVLEGDSSQLGLGLNETNRNLLIDKINIVFHCAATLNMASKMKVAVDTNVRGLSELLDLCQEMRYLKSMVVVSTAYSNCSQYVIEERMYDAPIQAATLMKLAEEIDEKLLDNITPGLIDDKWVNTYCYTKAVSESLLTIKRGNLPIGLFRPSIVMPTYFDPIPGWTVSINGPVGLMLVTGLGLVRVCNVDSKLKFDFIPVDFCVNALICSAVEVCQKMQTGKMGEQQEIPVYNCSSGPQRSITWKELKDYSMNYKYPLKNALWATILLFSTNRIYFNFLWFILHTIPGYLLDSYLFLSGQRPRIIKSYKKFLKFQETVHPFTSTEWNIINDNVRCLWNQLNETDQKLFPFDMDVMNYKEYVVNICTGLKLYILKENLDNVEVEKRKYQRLVKMHNVLKVIFILFVIASCYKLFSLVSVLF